MIKKKSAFFNRNHNSQQFFLRENQTMKYYNYEEQKIKLNKITIKVDFFIMKKI